MSVAPSTQLSFPPRASSKERNIPKESGKNDYAELRSIVKQQGLLEEHAINFYLNFCFTTLLLAASVGLLFLTQNFWIQMLNALLLGFVTGQYGFLLHDAGHRQIFKKTWKNDVVGYICGGLIGLSHQWWMDKHNLHHANPNREEVDSDIEVPILAFSENQARTKRGIARFIVKNQALLFFPIQCLTAFSMRKTCIKYILEQKSWKRFGLDCVLIATYYTLYFGLLFWALEPLTAFLFVIVHQMSNGLYMGSVFAPNHKGMPMIGKDEKIDFLREQVLTARNVRSHPLIDYWYGGLNYQIEHHLFTKISRNNLKKVHSIVREFCKKRSIPYHETGVIQSYREILQHMHEVSLVLRRAPASA